VNRSDKDIKQEIVPTLLLEECGVLKKWVIIIDRRQDSNAASTTAEKEGPTGFSVTYLSL